MLKQRRGVAGVPLCNCSSTCRWPRGKCPSGPLVFGSRPIVQLSEQAHACCGMHICKCERKYALHATFSGGDSGYSYFTPDELQSVVDAAEPQPVDELRASGPCRRCFGSSQGCEDCLPPAQPADELPEGWRDESDRSIELWRFVHTSGIAVHNSMLNPSDDGWCISHGDRSLEFLGSRARGRAEAMAAALGYEIVRFPIGNVFDWKHQSYNRVPGRVGSRHATSELAALDALRFDAEQRRKAQ